MRHASAANKISTTMADPKLEFTNLSRLNAESVGEPGKRTFRILADSDSSSAVLWLEKEHLYELAMGIQQLIANLPENAGTDGYISQDREAPGLTRLEFKIGKLALGHDGNNGMFLIDAYDFEDSNEEAATVRIWMDRKLLESFSDEALRVVCGGQANLSALRQADRPFRSRLPSRQRPREDRHRITGHPIDVPPTEQGTFTAPFTRAAI